jgi:hypothetical protein
VLPHTPEQEYANPFGGLKGANFWSAARRWSSSPSASSPGGTLKLTKTGITGGSVTRSGPWNYFLYGHFDGIQQKSNQSVACSDNYRRKVVAWEGDLYPDTSLGGAGGSPWGQCENAPNWGEYAGGSSFKHFSSTGAWYSASVEIPFPGVDINIGSSTGYENNVGFVYNNPSGAATTYFCASVALTDAHIIYNTS